MVTKREVISYDSYYSCVLAKIHMVTKPSCKHIVNYMGLCSSKNPYGNKTSAVASHVEPELCSSKNPYGNKTVVLDMIDRT